MSAWAKDEGLLPENPLAGMKRPKPTPRQRAMTDDEFQKLFENAGGPFADFLLALRETGARPKEVRDLRRECVQEDRWVLARHKTAQKTQKARVITLTDAMKAMAERFAGQRSLLHGIGGRCGILCTNSVYDGGMHGIPEGKGVRRSPLVR